MVQFVSYSVLGLFNLFLRLTAQIFMRRERGILFGKQSPYPHTEYTCSCYQTSRSERETPEEGLANASLGLKGNNTPNWFLSQGKKKKN